MVYLLDVVWHGVRDGRKARVAGPGVRVRARVRDRVGDRVRVRVGLGFEASVAGPRGLAHVGAHL